MNVKLRLYLRPADDLRKFSRSGKVAPFSIRAKKAEAAIFLALDDDRQSDFGQIAAGGCGILPEKQRCDQARQFGDFPFADEIRGAQAERFIPQLWRT